MRSLVSLPVIAAIYVAALTGCSTSTINVELEIVPIGERATVIEKLPLTIGVFYSQHFRNYTYKQCLEPPGHGRSTSRYYPPPCSGGYRIVVNNFGEASVALISRTMRALFARVETVDDQRPASRNSQVFAAIIEPEILEYAIYFHAGAVKVTYSATITYRLVLRTPGGEELARWSISGTSRETFQDITFISTGIRRATHSALRASEANTLIGFHERSEVRSWLSNRGIATVGSGKSDR